MKKYFICFAILAALGGCSTYSLEELRQTDPKGNEFQNALAQHYMNFATEAEANYDWGNSWHFADKGLLAAYAQEVGPEELANWNIPEEALGELEKARAELLAALTPTTLDKEPEAAARAQASFDCWVKNQEQNWQTNLINECRDDFASAMKELSDIREASKGSSTETSSYIVYFEWGQVQLTATATKIVDDVAKELADSDDYEVVLNGHTDTSGSQKFNMKLSLKRAEAVKARLVADGVKANAIKLFAYGETDLAQPTKDNVKEKTNRRVEIFLND